MSPQEADTPLGSEKTFGATEDFVISRGIFVGGEGAARVGRAAVGVFSPP